MRTCKAQAKYKLFVKSNEANPIVDGTVGNKKPRFVINPEGIKGTVGPIMHVIMKNIKCIPTLASKNAD